MPGVSGKVFEGKRTKTTDAEGTWNRLETGGRKKAT